MDEADWAINEFGAALLGDSRRTDRLIALATVLGQRPVASIPAACDDAAMRKGAYRFVENAAIDPAAILASHVEATWERVATRPVVLAVQDTTELDFSTHPATAGLGPISPWVTHGLLAHTTLAVTPEGLPLGLLAQEVWARPPLAPAARTTTKRAKRPRDARESRKWLKSLAAVGAGRAGAPQTTLVSVGDRDADLYDLFAVPRPAGVELLVRAQYDRWVRVASDDHRYIHGLRATLAQAPVACTRSVVVARQVGQPARTATVAIRWRAVTLQPPDARRKELPAVPVWAIWVHEEQPPAHVAEPLDWLLLTTAPVTTTAEAVERVEWYVCRWVIEVI